MSGGLLRDGLAALGIRPDAADLLERYLRELDRWNAKYGFVKATAEELVTKHALDSIAGASVVARLCEGARPGVLDVGSGAGFPGIPLAIALPGIRFTLLERSAKKCAFLENCRALLGLANVRVLQADLASASGGVEPRPRGGVEPRPRGGVEPRPRGGVEPRPRAGYDVVTFRAVAPLDRFLADLARSGIAWRYVASYKGRRDRIDEELSALGPAARGAEVLPLPVPFVDEERHLVVIPGS
jgi:16S rRNA (guanine527-N7)-methyltransferase